MKKEIITRNDIVIEAKKVSKHMNECLHIFMEDMDEVKSFNTILNKYGKKYGTALAVLAQKELQSYILEAKLTSNK